MKKGGKANEKMLTQYKEKIEKSEQFLAQSIDDYGVTASDIQSQAPTQFGMMNYSMTGDERRPGYSPYCKCVFLGG